MEFETMSFEKRGNIGILRLNRPPVNALSVKTYMELYEALDKIEKDDTTKALIFTASGEKAFCAGLDVKDVAEKDTREILDFLWNAVRKSLDKLSSFKKPTVAAIFGLVLGGGVELVLPCDLRIASEDTVLGFPEITLGILPGSGGTVRVPRLIGIAKAKELLLTGETINAQEALKIGLVNKVVEKAKLIDEAVGYAEKLGSRPSVAYGLIKTCIEKGMDMDVSSALALELNSFCIAYASEDGREGIKAFMERRKPEFKGR